MQDVFGASFLLASPDAKESTSTASSMPNQPPLQATGKSVIAVGQVANSCSEVYTRMPTFI